MPRPTFAIGSLSFGPPLPDTPLVRDGDTVTVGGRTYTFQEALDEGGGNVQIMAYGLDTAANLLHAINGTGIPGVQYAVATTPNPIVRATYRAPRGYGQLTVSALTPGETGNVVATTETLPAGSWGAATLQGGSGTVAAYLQELRATNTTDLDAATDTWLGELLARIGAEGEENVNTTAEVGAYLRQANINSAVASALEALVALP